MPDSVLIDPAAIQNLRDLGDEEFLQEIIGIFTEDAPRRLAELHSSYAAGDTGTFVRAAHSLKGSSSNLGAERLRALAEQLEQDAKTLGIASLDTRVAELESVYAATAAELFKLKPA